MNPLSTNTINITRQQLNKYAAMFSEILVANSLTPCLINKRNHPLKTNAYQELDSVMVFIWWLCASSRWKVWRTFNEHFETINDDSYFVTKWDLEALRHSVSNLWTIRPQRSEADIHSCHPPWHNVVNRKIPNLYTKSCSGGLIKVVTNYWKSEKACACAELVLLNLLELTNSKSLKLGRPV